jgi:hypothetical protein
MELRLEDWDVKYTGNRFAWMGNGYSQTEIDPRADWAFYVRDKDDDEPLSRLRKLQIISKSGTVVPSAGVSFTGRSTEGNDTMAEARL